MIKFQHQTNLLLGPVRKPTKSGKLRKLKHEDPVLNKRLETLSGLSESSESSNCDFPSDISFENDHVQTEQTNCGNKINSECELTEDFTFPTNEINISNLKEVVTPKKTKKLYNKSEEIFIPKIAPIPNEDNFSNPSRNYNEKQKKEKKQRLNPSTLPIEPPSSYGFISSFPFVPVDNQNCSPQSQEFKSDVEMLSLRTVPSVKSILNKTMPDLNRFFLNRWRENLIKEIGEDGFKKQQDGKNVLGL